MRNTLKRILALTCLLALLCGCSAPANQADEPSDSQTDTSVTTREPGEAPTEENPLLGVWVGDGTMDIMGIEHDIEFVNVWTFKSDDTAVAEKDKDDGTTETLEFTYTFTDDTITFAKDGATCSVTYTLDGDTLSFRTGIDTYAVFNRQK